jgi:transcriptional regulator with XRE-family HTH domain
MRNANNAGLNTSQRYRKIGSRVRALRFDLRIRQSDLSDRIALRHGGAWAISQKRISQIECGKIATLDIIEAELLAEALGTTTDKLTAP